MKILCLRKANTFDYFGKICCFKNYSWSSIKWKKIRLGDLLFNYANAVFNPKTLLNSWIETDITKPIRCVISDNDFVICKSKFRKETQSNIFLVFSFEYHWIHEAYIYSMEQFKRLVSLLCSLSKRMSHPGTATLWTLCDFFKFCPVKKTVI